MVDISGYFRSLTDISRYFVLVKFSGIIRLVESSGFFKYKVDISKNLRLMDLRGFFKFWFKVKTISYKTLLLTIGGGK